MCQGRKASKRTDLPFSRSEFSLEGLTMHRGEMSVVLDVRIYKELTDVSNEILDIGGIDC